LAIIYVVIKIVFSYYLEIYKSDRDRWDKKDIFLYSFYFEMIKIHFKTMLKIYLRYYSSNQTRFCIFYKTLTKYNHFNELYLIIDVRHVAENIIFIICAKFLIWERMRHISIEII
jgi:hypothetical protein